MAKPSAKELSRRERQLMEIVYQRGQATAAEIHEDLPDPPSYTAVRTMLRILEEKGHLKHIEQGPRYVYMPTVPRERARRSALQRTLQVFFDGSTEQAVASLLDLNRAKLTESDLDRLADLIEAAKQDRIAGLIEQARKEGR